MARERSSEVPAPLGTEAQAVLVLRLGFCGSVNNLQKEDVWLSPQTCKSFIYFALRGNSPLATVAHRGKRHKIRLRCTKGEQNMTVSK